MMSEAVEKSFDSTLASIALGPPLTETREELQPAVDEHAAELGRRHRRDADVGLLQRRHLRAELEERAAAR
jgi:hypothetical protein